MSSSEEYSKKQLKGMECLLAHILVYRCPEVSMFLLIIFVCFTAKMVLFPPVPFHCSSPPFS